MDNEGLAYMAGFFDGEGCVCITPIGRVTSRQSQTFSMRAQVVSTNKEIIELWKDSFGGDIKSRKIGGNRQACWVWRISAKQAAVVLGLMLPYLKIKKPQAQRAIEFQEHKTRGGRKGLGYIDYEHKVKDKISTMNRRGRDAMIAHGLIAAA